MIRTIQLLSVLLALSLPGSTWGFAATVSTPATQASTATLEVKDVVTKVAVAGATGRVGRLVVSELLDRGVTDVVALVRDTATAQEVFGDEVPEGLTITKCDISNEREMQKVLDSVDCLMWCATGFSQKPNANPLEKAKTFLDLALKRTIDVIALSSMAKMVKATNEQKGTQSQKLPKVIMCSSAGVTRPSWSEEKKALMPGAADIPIVRLNPFGALDIKADSEEKLRQTGVDYAIVRPCGLNDNHPAGSRPLFTQGDVAVGRINRKDVAKVMVDCLCAPEATGKTFEVIGVAGYQPPTSIRAPLSGLRTDKEGLPPLDVILSTYTTLQQLLPGETQDSAALAMGQTYEQLDRGEKGRLGQRGEERLDEAGPRPSA